MNPKLGLFVPSVANIIHERVELEGAFHAFVEIYEYAGVGVIAIVGADAVALGLTERVTIRTTALQLIAQAAVEVIVAVVGSPERAQAFVERVVHQLGDGAVRSSHHLAKIVADLQIAKRMVVIVNQRDDPRNESILLGPE